MGRLSRQDLTNVIKAFCSEVEKAGYYVGVYASLNWLDNKFYPDQLPYGNLGGSILFQMPIHRRNTACGSIPALEMSRESRGH